MIEGHSMARLNRKMSAVTRSASFLRTVTSRSVIMPFVILFHFDLTATSQMVERASDREAGFAGQCVDASAHEVESRPL